jgi:hypothetical protein
MLTDLILVEDTSCTFRQVGHVLLTNRLIRQQSIFFVEPLRAIQEIFCI